MMKMLNTVLELSDDYHKSSDLNMHNAAIASALDVALEIGEFDMQQLYESRVAGFIELMQQQGSASAGWSRKHSDGTGIEGWVISWIVAPTGREARYHIPLADAKSLPDFEHEFGRKWNGKEETLRALSDLI